MAKVPMSSDLRRKKWMREGLLQAKSKSFWTPLTGMTADSVVVQANNENASEGHTIVFDYDGNLSGKAIKGKDTAFGKGEQKKKFSNKLTVDRYRLVADNGDAFDAVDVGDLSLSQHSDSRAKLSDLYVRFKDQALNDAAQGLNGTAPSHIIELTAFDYNTLLDIERNLKTSTGFQSGATARSPLRPYMTADGKPMWMFVVDTTMATMLKKSTGYQTLVYNADVRGNENRAIKGIIGKIGNLMIVEADTFFGYTGHANSTIKMHDTEVEISGLRQRDDAGLWTGQDGFDAANIELSRGFIVGQNAIQLGMGKMPDYKWQPSQDFGIKSESALETWMEVQKVRLLAENDDYEAAKVAGHDYGIIAVDLDLTP